MNPKKIKSPSLTMSGVDVAWFVADAATGLVSGVGDPNLVARSSDWRCQAVGSLIPAYLGLVSLSVIKDCLSSLRSCYK